MFTEDVVVDGLRQPRFAPVAADAGAPVERANR
jgi:hypothetical protein